MRWRSPSWATAMLVVLVIAFLMGLGTANTRFTRSAQDANEFLPRWEASRAWLTLGWSPYDPRVSRAVQERLYGRAAVPEQGEESGLYLDPLPAMALYALSGLLDYPAARAAWMTLLEVMLVVAAVLSLRLASWRPPSMLVALLVAFGVAWPPGIRSIVDGHMAIPALASVVAALFYIESRRDLAAGVLLALAMADPIIGVLALVAGLAWAASCRRWTIVGAALGTTGLLLIGSLVLAPGWPIAWLQQIVLAVRAWREFGVGSGALSQGIRSAPGILAVVLIVAAAWVLWTCLGRGVRWLVWSMASLLVLGSWLTRLTTGTSSSVYLLPAVMLVLGGVAQRIPRMGNWIVASAVLIAGFGSWAVSLTSSGEAGGGIAGASAAPALACIGLLWVRWWATRGAEVRGLAFEGQDAGD